MNTVFHEAMSDSNRTYLESLTTTITPKLPLDRSQQDYWVAYGSIVVNGLKPESDIDMLYVSSDNEVKPVRHQAYFNERPVTVYAVSEQTLEDDGSSYLYGGYFSGKLLSPHVIQTQSPEAAGDIVTGIQKTVGDFMANFVQFSPGDNYTKQEVTRETLQSYLSLCPWYETYLLKFFESPSGETLYDTLPQHYASVLSAAGVISGNGTNFTASPEQQTQDSDTRQKNKIRAIARFWSYGAIEHDKDHLFADFYFDKAEATGKKMDPTGRQWEQMSQKLGLTGDKMT